MKIENEYMRTLTSSVPVKSCKLDPISTTLLWNLDSASPISNLEKLQSAYREGHSGKSGLLKVKTDILNSVDKQKVTCLILLDLCAAFDTVSNGLHLNCLWYRFGIQGQVAEWICSNLASWTQKVKLGDYESDPVTLKQGLPQGSVCGPILLSLYTSPIGDICRKHNVNYHGYTDDTQNDLSFSPNVPGDETTCLTTLQNCIQDIKIWMRTNLLKLSDEKTEFMIIGTRQQLQKSRQTHDRDRTGYYCKYTICKKSRFSLQWRELMSTNYAVDSKSRKSQK